ncbi:putative E3 ubiquitin-protein ligase HERC4-like isoform X2 [Dinothrombium tinctorium]|uniref:Putative E3 ubiquitin-protein ligase HERC4-like isoform X2 n=1 Tax=Dinothrombium tinctorium TaxID=1965070 RepID=A0A443QWW1_9ACAR|nr:putative E3 ubiquitin-protein ligase HERC4-like isoform X2 [Dinothrombium tinctorium]
MKSFVLSCGSNEKEQLGRQGTWKKFEAVECLNHYSVVQIASGFNHNLVLTEAGQVFAWGCNLYGQLGISRSSDTYVSKPMLIKRLGHEFIIQIACGGNHCLALSKTGVLHAWGSNIFGQIGISSREVNVYMPSVITSIRWVPIAYITAGGFHSVALSVTGVIYIWGKNEFGQLGLGDTTNRYSPCTINSLKDQNIRFIDCGENHTAALTKNGGVFTWGAGMYGQLGHGSTNNEILPRRVCELMGATVVQISCGRCHTLVVTEPCSKLFAFGLNGCGQLGIGNQANQVIPTLVRHSWIEHRIMEEEKQRTFHSVELEADNSSVHSLKLFQAATSCGDQSFILCTNGYSNIASIDHRHTLHSLPKILFFDISALESMINIPKDAQIPIESLEYLENVFSSICCWNGSFIKSRSELPKLDWDSALYGFKCLENVKNERIIEIITSIIMKQVIPDLPYLNSPLEIDAEVLRIYVLIPLFHVFHFKANYNKKVLKKFICGFAAAFLKLVSSKSINDIFRAWFGENINEILIRQLLITYKRVIITLLIEQNERNKDEFGDESLQSDGMETNTSENRSERQQNSMPQHHSMTSIDYDLHECLRLSLEMLAFVHKVNQTSRKLPYNDFYISEISEIVNVKYDYLKWWHAKETNPKTQNLFFFNYPFVFDSKAKSMVLEMDSKIQQKYAVENTISRTLIFCGAFAIFESPNLILSVARNKIVADTINILIHGGSKVNFKKPLQIQFEGEEAVDAGSGMKKEFFLLLLKEILDPKYGMFIEYKASNTIWFNPAETEELLMYHLIGILCGLAIYNQVIIYLPFPQILYKKLLNENLVIDDLSSLDEVLCKNVKDILSESYTPEQFNAAFGDMNFSVTINCYGSPVEYDLVEDGKNKYLNYENRQLYADLYWNFLINKSVSLQFEAFKSGFAKVLDERILSLFHAQELQQLITGQESYDWILLEKRGTEYKPLFNASHPTIIKFWNVFHSLSHDQKRKFLLFLTGSDRTPVQGLNSLRIKIQPMKVSEEHLPVAHVCFNLLDLPESYSSEAKLKSKLLIAIENIEGFTLV